MSPFDKRLRAEALGASQDSKDEGGEEVSITLQSHFKHFCSAPKTSELPHRCEKVVII